MWLRERLQKLEDLSPWGIIPSVIAASIALAVLMEKIGKLKSRLESFVLPGVQPVSTTTAQHLTNRLFLVVLGVIVAFVSFFRLYLQAELRRRSAVRNFDERKTKAYATLQGMMRAATLIRTQSYPGATRNKIFKRIHLRYLLDKEFNAEVTRSYSIAAINGPVHFWQESYRVRDAADATEYLLDINFKVKDTSGLGEVVYLPTEIDGRSKAISLYFLPQITPLEPGRQIEISYTWPKLAKSLQLLEEEQFNFNYDSLLPVAEVTLEIFLEPGTKGTLEGEIVGSRFPGATVSETRDGRLAGQECVIRHPIRQKVHASSTLFL